MTAGVVLGLAAIVAIQSPLIVWLALGLTRRWISVLEGMQARSDQRIAELTHRVGPESSALAAALLAPRPKQEDSKLVREIELPVPADLAWPPDPEEFRENSDGF